MAFTECDGAWGLFVENSRCRQPSIAGLLAIVSLLFAFTAFFVGRKFRP